jgi:hypothetical protein
LNVATAARFETQESASGLTDAIALVDLEMDL